MEPPAHAPRLGFGIVARHDPNPDDLEPLATRLESLGYQELWANDGGPRSGPATLRAAAGGARLLDLGVGVIPLSQRQPGEIAAEVIRLDLPRDRLIVGVGTGDGASLAAVRDGVAALRALLPGVRLAIAALGPRMCALGGEIADVVLLNWALPERIAWSRERIAQGAARAGRTVPRVAGYVRVALGPDAGQRLIAEADRYRSRQRPYVRLFEEQGATRASVPGVAAAQREDVPGLLAPYRAALDSCVVRALPAGPEVAELVGIAEAAVKVARA